VGDQRNRAFDGLRFSAFGLAAPCHQVLTELVSLRMDRDRFADRADAGRSLAALLGGYAGRDDVVVLGLPRGGVPVAAEIARVLGADLDVLVVRKLGVPSHPELAMGAIADVGHTVEVVTNDAVIGRLGITAADFDECMEVPRGGRWSRRSIGRDGLPAQGSGSTTIRSRLNRSSLLLPVW